MVTVSSGSWMSLRTDSVRVDARLSIIAQGTAESMAPMNPSRKMIES